MKQKQKYSETEAKTIVFILSTIVGLITFIIVAIFSQLIYGMVAGIISTIVLFKTFMPLVLENIRSNR